MESDNMGPQLPPHLRTKHQESTRKARSYDEHTEHKRTKYRESSRYRERSRERDRDRVKESRSRKREDDYRREKDVGVSRKYRREKDKRSKNERERVNKEEGTSKRSSRSKIDRTYNTDTEESSEEENQFRERSLRDLRSSSVSPDNLETSYNSGEEFSTETEKSNLEDQSFDAKTSSLKEQDTRKIGPALPPHLKSKENCEEAAAIGPVLPPHLIKKKSNEVSDDRDSSESSGSEEEFGTSKIPTEGKLKIKHKKLLSNSSEDISKAADFGPALPPKTFQGIGPSLPPHLKTTTTAIPAENNPPENEPSSDEEIVGPLLPEQIFKNQKNFLMQSQLEKSASNIKRRIEEKTEDLEQTNREQWMLELPPEKAMDFGLGPRQFSTRGAAEKGADRSSWTDTPADKARKEEQAKRRFESGSSSSDLRKESAQKQVSSRDKIMEQEVKKHSKKRSKESLLEAHQKKLKKKKKKEEEAGKKQERRPFNRDTDLKANVFDDAQKKAIFKKAQFLDNRFSSGESKYL